MYDCENYDKVYSESELEQKLPDMMQGMEKQLLSQVRLRSHIYAAVTFITAVGRAKLMGAYPHIGEHIASMFRMTMSRYDNRGDHNMRLLSSDLVHVSTFRNKGEYYGIRNIKPTSHKYAKFLCRIK